MAGQATYTASTATISAACTSDSSCGTNQCCTRVSRATIGATQTFTTVVQACMPYDLNGLNMPYNNQNYTFACVNTTTTAATAYITSLGAQCSDNSQCTTTGSCCAARSYQLWNTTMSLPSYCLSDSKKAGNFFWTTYTVTGIASSLIETSKCYASLPSLSLGYTLALQMATVLIGAVTILI